jgi:four helix bundle protein
MPEPDASRAQFERACLSIALNLSEGSARPTERDRRRFYFIALGSLREVQTLLDLYGTPELISQADTLGAHLYRLCHGAQRQ